MNRKIETIIILIASMTMGYIGGLMSQTNRRIIADDNSPAKIDIVKAQGFQLVDVNGKLLGEFGIIKNNPIIKLYDSKGNVRGAFLLADGNPALTIYDSEMKASGVFAMMDGEPNITLSDKNSKIRGTFSISGGDPSVVLKGTGQTGGSFMVFDNKPTLVLYDSTGTPVWWANKKE